MKMDQNTCASATAISCCSKKCLNLLSADEKDEFRRKYNLCTTFESRTTFLISNICEKPAFYVGGKRKFVRTYRVGSKDVCERSFREILGVSYTKIAKALEKSRDGCLLDKRSGSHNELPTKSKEEIVTHLNTFPRYLSHYRREQTASMFLDSDLTIAAMYRLFVEMWQEKSSGQIPPSIKTYKKVFDSLGLKIKCLKSDTCKSCDVFKSLIAKAAPEAKKKLEKERDDHWDKVAALRAQMKLDFETGKINKKVQGCCYDLEKTFGLPRASTSVFYYTRNINMYNLGVHDSKTDRGYFHTWIENQAGRGAQEIASCLIKFLDLHLQPEAEELILWSDSCGGQNRNRIMCVMLHHWLSKQRTLRRVCLRFLQSGHSYNICDTDFGSVENAIKKKQEVFTPTDVLDVMKTCRQKTPFDVTGMNTEDFLSVEHLIKNVTLRSVDGNTKTKVSWLSTHEIILERGRPYQLLMNYDVTKDEVSSSYCNVLKLAELIFICSILS